MAVGDKYNLMSKPDYSYCGYEKPTDAEVVEVVEEVREIGGGIILIKKKNGDVVPEMRAYLKKIE